MRPLSPIANSDCSLPDEQRSNRLILCEIVGFSGYSAILAASPASLYLGKKPNPVGSTSKPKLAYHLLPGEKASRYSTRMRRHVCARKSRKSVSCCSVIPFLKGILRIIENQWIVGIYHEAVLAFEIIGGIGKILKRT